MTTLANLTTYISGESQSFLTALDKTRGGLRSLVSSLDPVAAATARYNRQVDLLDKGLRNNQLTMEQHANLTQRLTQRYQEQVRGQTAVTASTGATRAGMQQLSFQLGDVATQFASGTSPMIIFAQQIGQVQQAVGLMTNSSKGLVGFLGGPWGQALTAAAIVVSALTAKLWDNADAAKAAELANDGLSDAQSVLGKMFDLTSGKLEKQNELLRLNARLTALNLRAEASKERRSATDTLGDTGDLSLSTYLLRSGLGINEVTKRAQAAARLAADVKAGRVSQEDALQRSEGMDFSGLAVDRTRFQQALSDQLSADAKEATAKLIDQSLNSGVLAKELRQEGRDKKPPKDRSDQREERFDDQLARLKQEQASLQLAITSDVRYQAGIQHEQVEAELAAYKEDLAHQVAQKEITAERAKQLLAVRERNAGLEHTRINWRLDDQLTRDELEARRDTLDAANEGLRAELDAARTQEDRRRIQLEILQNEQDLRRASLEAVKATHATNEAEYQLADAKLKRLDQETGYRRAAIERGTLGPMAEYLDRLPKSAAEVNEAFEHVAVDGLQSMNDGIADAIMGAKSLGSVFKNVANQIISDLLRIAVQQSITAPLAKALFGGGGAAGGVGGLLSGIGGLFGGGQTAAQLGINDYGRTGLPKLAMGGTIGGLGGIDQNVLSINGLPVARVGRGEMLRVEPNNDNGRRAISVHVEPSPYFDVRVQEVSGPLVQQGMVGAVGMSEQRSAKRARRRL